MFVKKIFIKKPKEAVNNHGINILTHYLLIKSFIVFLEAFKSMMNFWVQTLGLKIYGTGWLVNCTLTTNCNKHFPHNLFPLHNFYL